MRNILGRILHRNKKIFLTNLVRRQSNYSFDFDSDKEILENYLGNIMLIGINLPESKNVLTETAVEDMCQTIKNFELNKEISAAILHGIGGNFCTGVVTTEKALEKSKELIKILHSCKKPLIASLDGNTIKFGFQIATMCDLRCMEEQSLIGLGSEKEKEDIPDEVIARLFLTIGMTRTAELILQNCCWNSADAKEAGFANRIVSLGAGLGQAVVFAQSIALQQQKITIGYKEKFTSVLAKLSQMEHL